MMCETTETVMLDMREAEVKQLRQELADIRLYIDQYDIYVEALKAEVDRLKGILQCEYACDDLHAADL